MRKLIVSLTLMVIALIAVVPFINEVNGNAIQWLRGTPVAALNLFGWFVVLTFTLWRLDLHRRIVRIAQRLNLETRYLPVEKLINLLIREVERRNESLSLNILEKKINTQQELSHAFERIVALAIRLLDGESAEIALFDKETGLYHSSFVVGKPFRTSAQAMLSGAVEGESVEASPDVLIQPIAFAGAVLGSLRVGLKQGRIPSVGDRQIMSLLALHSGLAIINAQYTDQLLRMKRASEESIKAKTGFLANLSHELRGPIGIMINAVELVLDGLCGPVSEDQTETLQMIRSNGEHLLDLINDVLDYAKIESGKITPNKSEILVDDILKDLCAVVRKQAEAKSHKLVFKASDEVMAIHCDRRHFRQMMINFLTNAIKYTPDGGVIEVWAERTAQNKVKINVKDSGIGIGRADRKKVFSAFERIENSYSVTQMGTGLGMPFTKKLAEVNGALVDFKSKVNKGSHFWIMFKAIEAGHSFIQENYKDEPDAKGTGELVLLVQKEDGERKMITKYLSHIGFSVVPAASKMKALELLRKETFDIVLIDNNIVDKPGDDVVNAIRESAKASSLPVILVSSRAFIFDIEKYLKAGIDRCLIKPVHLKELGIICRRLIDGSYTGAVIDESELENAKSSEQKDSKLVTKDYSNADDLMH